MAACEYGVWSKRYMISWSCPLEVPYACRRLHHCRSAALHLWQCIAFRLLRCSPKTKFASVKWPWTYGAASSHFAVLLHYIGCPSSLDTAIFGAFSWMWVYNDVYIYRTCLLPMAHQKCTHSWVLDAIKCDWLASWSTTGHIMSALGSLVTCCCNCVCSTFGLTGSISISTLRSMAACGRGG